MTEAVPFQTNYGTINPGDRVFVTTVSTGWLDQFEATYVGMKNKSVQVDQQGEFWGHYDKVTGEKVSDPYSDKNYGRAEYKKVPGTRRITLQRNRVIPLTQG